MDITFTCNKCGQHIAIDEAGAGQVVDCPKCGIQLEVPHSSKPSDKPRPTAASGPPAADSRKCPFCAETIKAEARICRFCGCDLLTGKPPARSAATVSARAPSTLPKILTLLLIIASLVGGSFGYNLWKDQQRVRAEPNALAQLKQVVEQFQKRSVYGVMEDGINAVSNFQTDASKSDSLSSPYVGKVLYTRKSIWASGLSSNDEVRCTASFAYQQHQWVAVKIEADIALIPSREEGQLGEILDAHNRAVWKTINKTPCESEELNQWRRVGSTH